MNATFQFETIRNDAGLPVYVTVRPIRTVNNMDMDITFYDLQVALAGEVVAQVQRIHPTWSEAQILSQVNGTFF